MERINKYVREQGPICYEKQVFAVDDPQTAHELGLLLLASHLSWYWESVPSHDDPDYYESGSVPSERSLTELSLCNLSDLANDLIEFDLDGYGRFVALFGVDVSGFSVDSFSESLRSFVLDEKGPIRIALIRIGDMAPQYIFVPNQPTESVRSLLEAMGIVRKIPLNIISYNKLRLASLESLYKIYLCPNTSQ